MKKNRLLFFLLLMLCLLSVCAKADESPIRYTVQFEHLQEINSEIVAWLVQEGTDISFPIVRHQNNDYYFEHSFNGARNKTGSVFENCGNSPEFTDECTALYAHPNSEMSASLLNYSQADYALEHPTMRLITPSRDYEIEFFACAWESGEARDFSNQEAFEEAIRGVLENSLVDTGVIPQWGESILILNACSSADVRGKRFAVYARMKPLEYATDESISVTKMRMDSLEGTSRMIEVPGRGMMQYYAQNDPVWTKMIYEMRGLDTYRTLGQGGCGPTAMAIAIANVVPEEELIRLADYAKTEFVFCECSVNQYYCDRTHEQYTVTTAEEFRRYLPVILANFATGNNIWNEKSRTENRGTSVKFMKRAASIYNISFSVSKKWEEVLEALRRGAMVVASTGGEDSPFTGAGHYLTLAYADDDYVYMLDPYLKEDYSQTDKHHVLTQLEPGLLRANLQDKEKLLLYTFYIVEPLQ